jgi:hypothetical protein
MTTRTNIHGPTRKNEAFNRIELFATLAAVVLLALLALPAFGNAAARSQRSICVNNLRRIGIAWRSWSTERDRVPWNVPITNGGTYGFVNAWQHFLVASNELQTPRVLVCPSDTRRPATHFGQTPGGFARPLTGEDNALSYFMGLDALFTEPNNMLGGDRNIGGAAQKQGCNRLPQGFNIAAALTRASAQARIYSWTNALHGENAGNLLLMDGSVRQTTSRSLLDVIIEDTGDGNFTHHLIQP